MVQKSKTRVPGGMGWAGEMSRLEVHGHQKTQDTTFTPRSSSMIKENVEGKQ